MGDDEEQDTSLSQSHNASTYAASESRADDDTLQASGHEQDTYERGEDSLLDDADMSGSTPRQPTISGQAAKFADYGSPYEDLRRELRGSGPDDDDDGETDLVLPTTPGQQQQRLPDMSMTPLSSPFAPATYQPSAQRRADADPLLHRILDKNYRLQATPHTARKATASTVQTPATKPSWKDEGTPMSSPPAPAPQLNTEIFSSPIRERYNGGLASTAAPRTPGVSVQTPRKGSERGFGSKYEIGWESDSDSEGDVYKELGMSPPKTIQFALPQSRLLQTPGTFAWGVSRSPASPSTLLNRSSSSLGAQGFPFHVPPTDGDTQHEKRASALSRTCYGRLVPVRMIPMSWTARLW